MTGALAMHDHLLRELLNHHCGYEVSPYCVCFLHSLLCMSPCYCYKRLGQCIRFANLVEMLYGVIL